MIPWRDSCARYSAAALRYLDRGVEQFVGAAHAPVSATGRSSEMFDRTCPSERPRFDGVLRGRTSPRCGVVEIEGGMARILGSGFLDNPVHGCTCSRGWGGPRCASSCQRRLMSPGGGVAESRAPARGGFARKPTPTGRGRRIARRHAWRLVHLSRRDSWRARDRLPAAARYREATGRKKAAGMDRLVLKPSPLSAERGRARGDLSRLQKEAALPAARPALTSGDWLGQCHGASGRAFGLTTRWYHARR